MHLTSPPVEPDAALLARLGRWRRAAWAALLWEGLWPLLLPPLCVAGVLLALALFDVLPLLPGWLHGLVLAATAGSIAALLVRLVLRLPLPSADQAARRLERDSGLAHRPLDTLADQPVGKADDPLVQALWQAHRRRVAAHVGQLRIALPHPNMAARDPWGLRAAVLLLLVIAGTYAGPDWPKRLDRALAPSLGSMGIGPDSLEVWISPPAYTRIAPLVLRPDQPAEARPLSLPAGSSVLAVLTGGWGGAKLEVDGHATPFERQGDGSQRIETQLQAGHLLTVRQAGLSVASWSIAVVADAVPSIVFDAEPEPGERSRLRLALTASDDYGVAKAWVTMRRMGAPPDEAATIIDLPLPGGQPRTATMAGWFDLTAHPWAGLPVTLQPVTQDALGQTGMGEPMTVTLPERTFTNPVAVAVVDARRRITEDLAAVPEAALLLDRIAADPNLFNDDLKAFLMLRAARHALAADRFDLTDVQSLLWNGALRIEEGDLASAERSLEEARQALEQAVEEGASAAELERLLDQFQQALERYMQAMAERADVGQIPPLGAEGNTVTDDELRDMVDSLRDMAQSGSREALKQMLQDLSNLLDGLQAGSRQQAGGPAEEGMKELRELARRQQEMLDQSHSRAQMQQGQAQASPQSSQAAQAQEEMRKALAGAAGKLGQGLGEIPQALTDAESAMGDAAGELRGGRWGSAAEAQAQAVDLMRQAAREALEQMSGGAMMPRDPLGRPMRNGGTADDGTTKIPEQAELQRSRDLLNEIRRRAGEYQRPEPERDYLHRLLRQF